MRDILLNIGTDPVLKLIVRLFRRGRSPENSKMFPREDCGPITQEEVLRDRLEERTRCLNQRPR